MAARNWWGLNRNLVTGLLIRGLAARAVPATVLVLDFVYGLSQDTSRCLKFLLIPSGGLGFRVVLSMLTLRSATIGYGRQALAEGIDLDVQAGSITAILGVNGTGKSTLVKSILGIQSLLKGRLEWFPRRPATIAYLSQLNAFNQTFPMDMQALVATGAWGQRRAGLAAPAKIQAALERVEMADCAKMPVHELSGGQLQRARFARAIIQDAPLLILDEPFSAVDQQREAKLMDLILAWAKEEGRVVILVLHNLTAALQICDTALLLGRGGGDFGPAKHILTGERLVARGYFTRAQVDLLHKAAHG